MYMYSYIYIYLHCAIHIYIYMYIFGGTPLPSNVSFFFLTVPSASRGFPTRLSVVIGSIGHGASGQVLRAEGATLQGWLVV